jgi:hypothetical protein
MSSKIAPSLESITIKAKYSIAGTDFFDVKKRLYDYLKQEGNWKVHSEIGNSIVFLYYLGAEELDKYLKKKRPGVPFYLSLIVLEKLSDRILFEIECRPAMWYRISNLQEEKFTENQVQEALLEARSFVKQTMSVFYAREEEPVSVYPIIQRTEIKSRLLNLGLKDTIDHLNNAERHIVQNNFEESLKSSRTAFEKMIDWELKKRGLEETNNYKNNIERLRSKGFIDSITTEFLQAYYHCLSGIVHDKVEVKPGFHEAQMGYGMTLIILQYFADKLP